MLALKNFVQRLVGYGFGPSSGQVRAVFQVHNRFGLQFGFGEGVICAVEVLYSDYSVDGFGGWGHGSELPQLVGSR